MTREEAKTVFLNRGYVEVEGGTIYDANKWRESCRVISEWLEQESTTKDYLEVDAISRQEAIDIIRQLYLDLASQKAVIDLLKVLPSVTPQEPKWIPIERLPKHYDSHDLIHRETARRIIDSPRTKEQMLMVLASAENQKKTGHWEMPVQDDGMSDPIYYQVRCSKCGFDLDPQTWHMELHQYSADKYCPKCGCNMSEIPTSSKPEISSYYGLRSYVGKRSDKE